MLLPKPVIFSNGMFIPLDFNHSCIGCAASCIRAVSTNTFLLPYLAIWFFIFCNNGPSFPPLTLTKSEKSKSQFSSAYLGPSIGHLADGILTVSPSLVAVTKFLPSIISVSSKSKVDMPLEGFKLLSLAFTSFLEFCIFNCEFNVVSVDFIKLLVCEASNKFALLLTNLDSFILGSTLYFILPFFGASILATSSIISPSFNFNLCILLFGFKRLNSAATALLTLSTVSLPVVIT